jgi:predicted exporter
MPHRWRARLLVPLFALVLGLAFWMVEIKTDVSTFIVAGTSTEELLLASQMQSGKLSRRYILSLGHGKDNRIELERFARRFLDKLREMDEVVDVWIADEPTGLVETITLLYPPHASRIYSLHPEQEAPELFEPQHLNERAQRIKESLLAPQERIIKNIVLQDPLLLSLDAFRTVLIQKQKRILTADKTPYINIILETRHSGLDVPVHKILQHEIRTLFDAARRNNDGMTLEMTGIPVFAAATQSLIAGDIQRVTVLAGVALSALYLWLFRSLRSLFWVTLVLGLSFASAMLITQLLFGYVHGLTIAIGATLIGVCIDYPIHAIAHAGASSAPEKRAVIVKIWPSLLLGGITTIIGYAALGLSGYPGFQQIAVYAGSGILFSLLLTRYLLPSLLFGWQSRRYASTDSPLWLSWCDRRATLFRIMLALGILFSLFFLTRLQWLDDLQRLTPELDPIKEQDRAIRSRLSLSIEPGRFILITGDDLESALQTGERLYPVLERLKKEEALAHYYGLYPWLISSSLQQRNRMALDRELTDRNKERWREALIKAGLSTTRLAQLNYSGMELLSPQTVLDSPVQQLISNQIASNPEQTLLIVWLAKHQPEAVTAAIRNLPGVRYFSQREMLNRLAADYRQRAVLMLGLGVVMILGLLTARYRQPLQALTVLAPALCSGLILLASWSAGGFVLSFLHLVALLLVVAICVDYGIFFFENRSGNRTLTYRAMSASMLTSVVAFASLGAAQSASLRTLAITVAFGVALGFLLCPVVIRNQRIIADRPPNLRPTQLPGP